MLSFDITDRNIRVVKGVESGGKIKISSAATLQIDEELIINGHVKDVPNVATLINGVLKKNKMPDKEAIVSISSNLTIFKELNVQKVKINEMQKAVKQQMQAELNLDDSYSVTYTIVGDGEGNTYKVLATACPYEIVNSYREVFKLLGISLRSVMIGCNCITKVLLADTKIKSKMPLLAVQIDNNFISLNLYEADQLSFSRFASIDPADYGNSEDYVFEAVNENIFRMLQFHRSRNTGETIENIVFYGDTHDFVRLTDELGKMDLSTSLINVPPQIHGHENLEFSLYANAIGAMFKRTRETEKLNLLETDLSTALKGRATSQHSDKEGDIFMLCSLGVALVIGLSGWGIQTARNNKIEKQIQEIQEFIDSPDTAEKIAHLTRLETMKTKVDEYNVSMVNAHDGFYSQPVINGDKYDLLQTVLDETVESIPELDIEKFEVSEPKYSEGAMSYIVTCDVQDSFVQELPAIYVENILSQPEFDAANYKGYQVSVKKTGTGEQQEEREVVTFNMEVHLAGRQSAYHAEEEKADETDSETSEATE